MLKFDDGGLRNVWVENGYTVRQTKYGRATAYSDLEGLVRAVCRALVRKAGRLTGVEFRYLRLNLALSQESLAKFWGMSGQSVALWEKRGRIPLYADKNLRLLWLAGNDGNETVKQAIERVNLVERLVNQRIVVREGRGGWRASVVDDGAKEPA